MIGFAADTGKSVEAERQARYRQAVDASRHALLEKTPPKQPFFATVVMIGPGAWQWLRQFGDIGYHDAERTAVVVHESGGRYLKREQCRLTNLAEITALFGHLRETIAKGGGGFIRQPSADETERLLSHGWDGKAHTEVVIEIGDGSHVIVVGIRPAGEADFIDDVASVP